MDMNSLHLAMYYSEWWVCGTILVMFWTFFTVKIGSI